MKIYKWFVGRICARDAFKSEIKLWVVLGFREDLNNFINSSLCWYISPSCLNWSVCSFFNRRDFMSCCIVSSNRFFCRPRLQRPLTSAVIILFIQFLSSLLITWPYHLNLASGILSVMHAWCKCGEDFLLLCIFSIWMKNDIWKRWLPGRMPHSRNQRISALGQTWSYFLTIWVKCNCLKIHLCKQYRIDVGRGGALVEAITFNWRVVGSTPTLAAT